MVNLVDANRGMSTLGFFRFYKSMISPDWSEEILWRGMLTSVGKEEMLALLPELTPLFQI